MASFAEVMPAAMASLSVARCRHTLKTDDAFGPVPCGLLKDDDEGEESEALSTDCEAVCRRGGGGGGSTCDTKLRGGGGGTRRTIEAGDGSLELSATCSPLLLRTDEVLDAPADANDEEESFETIAGFPISNSGPETLLERLPSCSTSSSSSGSSAVDVGTDRETSRWPVRMSSIDDDATTLGDSDRDRKTSRSFAAASSVASLEAVGSVEGALGGVDAAEVGLRVEPNHVFFLVGVVSPS